MADAAPAEAPKGKGIFLMVLIAVIALAAGGGGAFLFLGGKGNHAAAAEKEGKGEKGEEKAPKLPAQYVKLDPPFVVNFEAKGLMRFLQVSVEVMTRDAETVELLKKNDAMIRNDLILLLGSQKYEAISTREGKEQLRAEALQVVGKVIGAEGGMPEHVEQLFFTSFVMQ